MYNLVMLINFISEIEIYKDLSIKDFLSLYFMYLSLFVLLLLRVIL